DRQDRYIPEFISRKPLDILTPPVTLDERLIWIINLNDTIYPWDLDNIPDPGDDGDVRVTRRERPATPNGEEFSALGHGYPPDGFAGVEGDHDVGEGHLGLKGEKNKDDAENHNGPQYRSRLREAPHESPSSYLAFSIACTS
ncbi:MAG: hypothetical protein ACREUU_05000, partial [Gammaproteobacteria bacterium]